MRIQLPVALVAIVAGCSPQNATVTEGSMQAFFAVSTSQLLLNGEVTTEDLAQFDDYFRVDCRDIDEDDKLDDALDICSSFDPEQESWLVEDGFEVVKQALDPWRGEAIITSEGDLQITFHQRLPGFGDSRFAFVVDPDFAPTACQLDDAGNSVLEPIDGDWVTQWSADADGSTRYYINAGAYQFNPSQLNPYQDNFYLYLPDEWLAGFAIAKIGGEDMYVRPTRYAQPWVYAGDSSEGLGQGEVSRDDLFFVSMEEGSDPASVSAFAEKLDEVDTIATEIHNDFAEVQVDEIQPVVHSNAWRTPDGSEPGLDGWIELHYSYVDFDQAPADLIAGNPASGTVNLFLDSIDSQSHLAIQASFTVDKIKNDKWTMENLEEVKLEEYGTDLCGGTSSAE